MPAPDQVLFAVHSPRAELQTRVAELAAHLNAPHLSQDTDPKQCSAAKYLLVVDADGIGIKQTGPHTTGIVTVDFIAGAANHRRLYGGGKSQLIAKAVGLNKGIHPTILDATTGLGADAFVLASLGCSITMLERSPLIALLLEDGLVRALQMAELKPILQRMQLICADSVEYMANIAEENRPDIVYLDPMFPERSKTAKVKKEMTFFHDLVGFAQDENELLNIALRTATKRVVVKRPKSASPLAGSLAERAPNFEFAGKSSRYDIYTLSRLA